MLMPAHATENTITTLLAKELERQNVIEKGIAKMLESDKKLRIDNQYYLKNKKVPLDYNSLRDFILKMKEIVNTLSNEEIERIRKRIKAAIS